MISTQRDHAVTERLRQERRERERPPETSIDDADRVARRAIDQLEAWRNDEGAPDSQLRTILHEAQASLDRLAPDDSEPDAKGRP